MQDDCKVKRVVIPAGQSVSGWVDLENGQVAVIHMPAVWTAAAITFDSAPEGSGPYQPLFDDGGVEVALTVSGGRNCGIDINALKLSAVRFLRVRSGTSALPVVQAAERVLWIVTKR